MALQLGLDLSDDLNSDVARWAVYAAALTAPVVRDDVLPALRLETDQALAGAVVVRAIELGQGPEREDWIATLADEDQRDFCTQRLAETRLLSVLDDGQEVLDDERRRSLLAGTDWLQRRAADQCESSEVLELLAVAGRSRRVRGRARQRLRPGSAR